MSEPVRDRWAVWLLNGRQHDDVDKQRAALEHYHRWRDQVLENAAVGTATRCSTWARVTA